MPQSTARAATPRSRRFALTALAVACLLAAPAQAESNAGPITFDVMVLRPLNFMQTVTGAVLFVPVALFSSIAPFCTGNTDEGKSTVGEAWDIFVFEPAERTFLLPLGSF